MQKAYILDSSVLLEDANCIEILKNGEENLIYIPHEVLLEIDGLKKNSQKGHLAREAISKLYEFRDFIEILETKTTTKNDTRILDEILFHKPTLEKQHPLFFVTNDLLLALRAEKNGIQTQSYKSCLPFQSESQKYTGFINLDEGDEYVNNCFYWRTGELFYNKQGKEKLINYENSIWKLKPRTYQQNAAMELLIDRKIPIVSIQSGPGFGKTTLALAAALQLVLEYKAHKKIYVFKHHVEVGTEELGFLPGNFEEKTAPYFQPIMDVIEKLHEIREANKIFMDPKSMELRLNPKVIKLQSLNFVRGAEFSDCVVILDEAQNYTRKDMKILLSRCGENVKCIVIGDVSQIDNIHCNEDNNGLNWLLKAFKGNEKYAHVVLKGKNSRGEIADMVRNSIL